VASQSFSTIQADTILLFPENQGIDYPAADETRWPTPIVDPARTDETLFPPFDGTIGDRIDNTTPPVNEEVGLYAQRYFTVRLGAPATVLAGATSTASLRVEILDLENEILAGGAPNALAVLGAGTYILRVLPAAGPVAADFDLRIQLAP
jgi:hypothetical protein